MYPNSNVLSHITVHQDMLWHYGNVNTLSMEFPPMDPRVSGIVFKYHYFVDLFYAFCMKYTGVGAEAQIMSVAPIILPFILVGSVYSIGREFIISNKKQVLFAFLALFMGVFNVYYITGHKSVESMYANHLFSNINSMGYSIAADMMFSVILIRFIKNMENDNNYIGDGISLSILIFVTAGLKGPVVAVLIAALIVILTIIAFMKVSNKKNITLMFIAITYILLLSNPAGGGVELTLFDIVGRSIMGEYISSLNGVKKGIATIIAIPIEFILLFGGFAIAFLAYVFEYVCSYF